MKRVLMIRPSAIGDIVMASPLIRALRDAWPDAYLAWLVDPAARDLLAHNPALDAVIDWSKAEWRSLLRRGHWWKLGKAVAQFRHTLHRHQFNLALDLQGLFRSRLLARICGARNRWGFDSREPGRFLMTRIVSRGPDKTAMSSEYRHLAGQLGIEPGSFAPDIVLSERAGASAQQICHPFDLQEPFAVVCPFTTRPQKHWINERWAQLIEQLHHRARLPVFILGGPHDVGDSQRIAGMANAPVYNFTGKTGIGESAAIIQHAALIIGVDTGLTHLGSAFASPTIALFGATCPYLSTESKFTHIIYHHLACSPCKRKPTCEGRYDCMRAIQVDTVYAAARQLLKRATTHAHEDSSH
jgi:heptosyltransferase-1